MLSCTNISNLLLVLNSLMTVLVPTTLNLERGFLVTSVVGSGHSNLKNMLMNNTGWSYCKDNKGPRKQLEIFFSFCKYKIYSIEFSCLLIYGCMDVFCYFLLERFLFIMYITRILIESITLILE